MTAPMSPLLKTLIHRLVASLVVLAGVSMLMFLIARVIPGDPARIALGPNATEAQVQALRHERHLDEPIPVQYWEYIRELAHGNLGNSLYSNRPVRVDIAQYLPATLELVFAAGLMMTLIGIPVGVLSARYRGRWGDHVGRIASIMGVSTPAFVWGVILQLVFAYLWRLFPIEGRLTATLPGPPPMTGFVLIDAALAGDGGALVDALHHLVLPALALAMAGIGQTARLTRASMVETYHKPFIEMAHAYGFRESRIANRYAFKPALVPVLTILGLDLAALLGNAFLVESVFGWPGLSRYGVEVILHKDLDAIVGTVLIIATAFLIANIAVDLLVALVNPRIRFAGGRS
jgi:peptide/nickel transport system permease protein